MFVIEIEKGHPRAEIGKVLTLLGALGLSTQVITPRTRSLDEAERSTRCSPACSTTGWSRWRPNTGRP